MKTTVVSHVSVSARTRATVALPDGLAVGALVLAAFAAAIGLLIGGVYRDNAEAVRQARATDLVTLVGAVPVLAFGLWRARSGSRFGRVGAVGALGYLAYSYAIYAFSVVINPLTPVHVAILGLATWALILVLFGRRAVPFLDSMPVRLPRSGTGLFLFVVAGLFALLWLSQIGGAISSGTLPIAVRDLNLPTSPVYVLDLAFALPVLAVTGSWLLRHDPRGPAAALAALTFVLLMGLSVLAILVVDAAAGMPVEVAPIVIFGFVTGLAGAILARAAFAAAALGRRS